MAYSATIDNDSVAALTAVQFRGRIVVVDCDDAVDAACDDLEHYDVIGFDTETRPSFQAGVSHKVSLLQLSTPTTCYLFRLCRIRLSNRILKILGSRRILKVGADVAGDIRSLHALRDFREDGFVDLQHIAPHWGIEEKSLRKLSAIVLGMRVSKAQRLSNWEAGILTRQQRDYAATDAWVCIRIFETLRREEPLTPLGDIVCPPVSRTPKSDAKHSTHHRFKGRRPQTKARSEAEQSAEVRHKEHKTDNI